MSSDAATRKFAGIRLARGEKAARGKHWWLRWVVLSVVAIVLGVEVILVRDQLAKAWTSLFEAN